MVRIRGGTNVTNATNSRLLEGCWGLPHLKKCLGFLVSRVLGFLVSEFLGFLVSKVQKNVLFFIICVPYYQMSISCFFRY